MNKLKGSLTRTEVYILLIESRKSSNKYKHHEMLTTLPDYMYFTVRFYKERFLQPLKK